MLTTIPNYPRRRDIKTIDPANILDEYSGDSLEVILFMTNDPVHPYGIRTMLVETPEDGETIPEGDELIIVDEVTKYRTQLGAEEAFRAEVGAIGNPTV